MFAHLPFAHARSRLASVRVFCLAIVLAATAPSVGHAAVIGSWDSARGGVFSLSQGSEMEIYRELIPAAFPGTTFAGSSVLTPEFLSAVDVIVVTCAFDNFNEIAPLSPTEQAALFDFVLAGGSALILGDRTGLAPTATPSMMSPFGLAVEGNLIGTYYATVIDPYLNPITHSPFGEVTRLSTYYPGWFSDTGDALPLATLDQNGQPLLAVFVENALGPGSGRVVLAADQNLYRGNFNLVGNSIAYLLYVPEPSSWALSLCAIPAALGLRRVRRESRKPRSANGCQRRP